MNAPRLIAAHAQVRPHNAERAERDDRVRTCGLVSRPRVPRPTGASLSQAPVGGDTRAATASLVWTRKVKVSSKYRLMLVASWER